MNRCKIPSQKFLHSLLLATTVLLLATGCSTLPISKDAAQNELNGTTLAAAQHLLSKADTMGANKQHAEAAMVYRLRAAEIAWNHLGAPHNPARKGTAMPTDPQDRLALDIHARASGAVAKHVVARNGQARTFSYAGYRYRVDPAVGRPDLLDPATLQDVKPAREVPRRILKNWYAAEGVGEPLIPATRLPTDPVALRFAPPRTYLTYATAALTFQGGDGGDGERTARLELIVPEANSSLRIASNTYPLAYDLTAPLYNEVAGIPELLRSLSGFFIADKAQARLIMLEPYAPDQIPVVFVHGLISNPIMWRDVINELQAIPEIRSRYQFWAFFYPTGWPITYSAKHLRDELEAADEAYGPLDEMVLVGHSMGGLLTRLQIISPERAIWDAQFEDRADALFKKLPADSLVRSMLLFEANHEIDRAVFISTPHRGSRIADFSPVRWVMSLIRQPGQIMRTLIDLPGIELDRLKLTSISSLSPSNPTLLAMEDIPIEAHYHSIIGDRGRGDTPHSSDGVVEYRSSHLDGAESEIIVPSDHGAHDDPAAIKEVERILALHAGLPVPEALKHLEATNQVTPGALSKTADRVHSSASRHPARRW